MSTLDEDSYIKVTPKKTSERKITETQHFEGDIVEDEVTYWFYDLNGHEVIDELNAVAKFNNNKFFYVKFGVEGADRGHMFNPYSIYYQPGDLHRKAPKRGCMRFEFKKVTQEQFDLYIEFLRTRNSAIRIQAERGGDYAD